MSWRVLRLQLFEFGMSRVCRAQHSLEMLFASKFAKRRHFVGSSRARKKRASSLFRVGDLTGSN